MKSTNSNRSSSLQSALAWRMNTAVSATVTGRARICGMYAIGAHFLPIATDGGDALILVAAERACDFPQSMALAGSMRLVYLLGTGESVETPMVASHVIPAKAGI